MKINSTNKPSGAQIQAQGVESANRTRDERKIEP